MKIFRYIYVLKFFLVKFYCFGHIYVSFSLIYMLLGLFWRVLLGLQICNPRLVRTGLGPWSFILKNWETGTAVPVFSSPSLVQLWLFAVHRTRPLNTTPGWPDWIRTELFPMWQDAAEWIIPFIVRFCYDFTSFSVPLLFSTLTLPIYGYLFFSFFSFLITHTRLLMCLFMHSPANWCAYSYAVLLTHTQ